MSFPQKVKSALWAIMDIMALNPDRFVKNPRKDFSRERKLGFVQMLRLCICMESGCISHELLRYFFFNPDESPTASAFIQQRAKLLPETFYHLLRQFNLRFTTKPFRGKYSLIAADSSEFNIARNPEDKATFHPSNGKSKKGFNMVHTVSLFELFSKRYLGMIFQPGREKKWICSPVQADRPFFLWRLSDLCSWQGICQLQCICPCAGERVLFCHPCERH